MNIIGINGSLRPGSVTKQLIETVLKSAEASGASTQLLDLTQYTLPMCNGTDHYSAQDKKTIEVLKNTLNKADGFIIGTPEYHGGYSGVLKNFLDLMSGDQFKGKLVGLVGAAGGRLGADGSLNQLRVVFKNLQSVCYPTQVSSTGADVENNTLKNATVIKRLEEMGQGFTKMLTALKTQ